MKRFTLTFILLLVASTAFAQDYLGSRYTTPIGDLRSNNPYDSQSLYNPYGAGSRFKSDGLLNSYGRHGSPYSNESWTNPYATSPPKLYEGSSYRGRLSANPYSRDSTSNRYGRYGSRYSPDSINNTYGAGSKFRSQPLYVYPGR
jgi:hypothetical protein